METIKYTYVTDSGSIVYVSWRGELDTAVKAAVKRLNAQPIGDDYVYYAAETGTWFVVSMHDVARLGAAICAGRGTKDWYPLWCSRVTADEYATLEDALAAHD